MSRAKSLPLSIRDLLRTAYVSLSFFTLFWVSAVYLPGNDSEYHEFDYASLVYLPHGVRVIAAWLYGWRSVMYLAPGSYMVHFARIDEHPELWTAGGVLMPVFGIFCVAMTFEAIARFGADLRLQTGWRAPWRSVLLVGALGSFINAIGANLIVQNPVEVMLGFLIGDIIGMMVLFLTLMLLFSGLRRAGY